MNFVFIFSEDWTCERPDESWFWLGSGDGTLSTHKFCIISSLSVPRKKERQKTSERAKAWPQSSQPGRYNPITLPRAKLAFNASQYIILYILLSLSWLCFEEAALKIAFQFPLPKLQIISTPTRCVIRTWELKQITCRLLHDQFINLRQRAWIRAEV